ncbi:hypothetical protein [Myceligenerans salitolerans]|uniref:Uncharacterized protein n=1 Tax=Myceligenerans salitolerans TaxID=1230528 RepID=A0ABS3ICE9_9MICO|nr:hypothetical protein [Myceligenerans salitolerans]MBO0610705.1 hypothetical protein [Myceligenerans salitolerans]
MRTSHRERSAEKGALELALGTAIGMVAKVGGERLDVVAVTRNRVCLSPRDLTDGEEIAQVLQCAIPLDHRLTVPEYTMWTGRRGDLEVQVRSALRDPAVAHGTGALE